MIYIDFTGAVFRYMLVNTAVWWFFHLSIFVYQMMFPFHAKRAKHTGKLNYVTMILPRIILRYNDDVIPLGLHEETPNQSLLIL